MTKLLVFLNFIKASEKALDQAISLGRKDGAKLFLCHILKEKGNEKDVLQKLEPYAEKVRKAKLETEIEIEYGTLFEAAAIVAKRIKPDLVIAGNRGAESFDMSIFGSAIYKFVRDVSYTSLVLREESKIAELGFKNVILPVSPHGNFLKKVKESTKVLANDGKILILSLIKEGAEPDDLIEKNIQITREYLDRLGLQWELKEFITAKNDHNLARQTLGRLSELNADLISISADVSARNKHFGKMHKEDILFNEAFIPVLCVNTDFE